MFKKLEVKTLVVGILMGGMVSFGTYFLLPPPQSTSAAVGGMGYYELRTDYDFKKAVRYIVENCEVDGAEISC
jgi:hypothetical protein